MPVPPALPSPAVIAEAFHHLEAAKMFQLASYTMLLYDHLITFSDEVNRIWKRPLSGATILFALNRYVTPLQFGVGVAAFFSPAWSANLLRPACAHFVRFEGGSTLAMVAICEIVMIVRVYALWGRDNRVLAFLSLLWVAQVIMAGVVVGLTTSLAPLPPGFTGCILAGGGSLFPPFYVMPLVTDTAIFGLTMWRTQKFASHGSHGMPMVQRFRRDGILYFLCIFSANLLNVILYFAAAGDLKAIGASFSQLITSVMVSRLVLNLRGVGTSTQHSAYSGSTYASTLIGNLGSDMHTAKAESGVNTFSSDAETIDMYIMKNEW